jgi:cold shock CspA family protein
MPAHLQGTGTVTYFGRTFGFIDPDDGSSSVLVAASCLLAARIDNVEPGDRLRFWAKHRGRGWRAQRVALEK